MNLVSISIITETVVNSQFDIIRTSKWLGLIIRFLNKLSKTSQKDGLELLQVENWKTVAWTKWKQTTR